MIHRWFALVIAAFTVVLGASDFAAAYDYDVVPGDGAAASQSDSLVTVGAFERAAVADLSVGSGVGTRLLPGAHLFAPRPGVLVDGAGSGTRTINFRPGAADPNWGLTPAHLDKHLFGSGKHSLSQIDAAGNPDLWRGYIQDLASRPTTTTLKGRIEDVIGTFQKADGSGTFQFSIRISPNSDGTFDLVTLLTKQ